MTHALPTLALGRAALRALGAPRGLIPLVDYLEAHGCGKRAVYKRKDIPTTKINGIAFVPANAPAIRGRGGSK